MLIIRRFLRPFSLARADLEPVGRKGYVIAGERGQMRGRMMTLGWILGLDTQRRRLLGSPYCVPLVSALSVDGSLAKVEASLPKLTAEKFAGLVPRFLLPSGLASLKHVPAGGGTAKPHRSSDPGGHPWLLCRWRGVTGPATGGSPGPGQGSAGLCSSESSSERPRLEGRLK